MTDVSPESNESKQWEELWRKKKPADIKSHLDTMIKWEVIGLKDVNDRNDFLEDMYSWLSASKINGFLLCSQVEKGVKQERSATGTGANMFIAWAGTPVNSGLVQGPATMLFNALAPFAQGSTGAPWPWSQLGSLVTEVKGVAHRVLNIKLVDPSMGVFRKGTQSNDTAYNKKCVRLGQGKVLFVRDEYSRIFGEWEQLAKPFLVVGTPGTGKSVFVHFAINQLITRPKPPPDIVCHISDGSQSKFSGHIVWYREGRLFRYRVGADLDSEERTALNNPNAYYIVDDLPPIQPLSPNIASPGIGTAHALLTTSPNNDIYDQYRKTSISRVMEPWTEVEIREFCGLPSDINGLTLPLGIIMERFSKLGGIPRILFDSSEFNPLSLIDRSVSDLCKHEKLESTLDNAEKLGNVASRDLKGMHVCVHIRRVPSGLGVNSDDSKICSFASGHVSRALAKALLETQQKRLQLLVSATAGLGKLGAWRGHVFEGHCHNTLSRPGTLQGRT